MNPKIRLEDHGHWAWLIVDRPEAKNAIDRETMVQLKETILKLKLREDLVLLGIRGAGDIFIAGGDIKDLALIKDASSAEQMSSEMNGVLIALGELDCLSVAVINGDAYGGGCELALACDVRILQSGSRLFFKQAAMGLTPGWGGGQRLARLLGPGKATMYYATGAVVESAEALSSGLVDFVDENVTERIEAWAKRMEKYSPMAIRYTKRAIREGQTKSTAEAFEAETRLFGECWASEPHHQAVAAFLKRR